MKKLICMLLVLLMMACASATAENAAKLTVQGNGAVTAEPDIVTVTVNVSMTAGTMLDAQKQVSAVVEKATAKLLELGVLEDDVVTTDYGYSPQYNYNYDNDVRRLIGYQASHTLEITCRDVEMIDGVIGVVTDSGMTDIYSVSYGIADRSKLYLQALDLAIRSAREKADAMAASAGLKVEGLESLNENQSYDARYSLKSAAVTEDAAGINTGIRTGGVGVSASVTAVFRAQ